MSGRGSELLTGVWRADGLGTRLLAPASWLFGAGVAVRNAAYDAGVFRASSTGWPTLSVGNLTVGGTGKTPMTAWLAQRLIARNRHPGILLRGYRGEDETLVHRLLTPTARVVADPDRLRGAARARAEGADVLILDDGFQHRRVRRDLDLVLVSAEDGAARRLLPAGPLREGRGALRRAQVLIVTRKTASQDEAADVATAWGARHEHLSLVVAALAPTTLLPVRSDDAAGGIGLERIAGTEVLAISAIGAPAAFEGQLGALGGRVRAARFPDHHAFSDDEIARLAGDAPHTGLVVCTLKDAVKLRGRWPREAPPLWYLSQAVTVEWGAEELGSHLTRVVTPQKD
jgi:tetraacyldisaccharide 4'-kinase